jgi:hypothetical protein
MYVFEEQEHQRYLQTKLQALDSPEVITRSGIPNELESQDAELPSDVDSENCAAERWKLLMKIKNALEEYSRDTTRTGFFLCYNLP